MFCTLNKCFPCGFKGGPLCNGQLIPMTDSQFSGPPTEYLEQTEALAKNPKDNPDQLWSVLLSHVAGPVFTKSELAGFTICSGHLVKHLF